MASIDRTYRFADGVEMFPSRVDSELSQMIQAWNNHDQAISAWTKIYVSGTTRFSGGTYTWPASLPVSTSLLQTNSSGTLSWVGSTGAFAPVGSSYVVISTDSILSSERVLTGTGNQITVTDNGAGSSVVLSTPQNIHTGATPTFTGMSANSAKITSLANGTASTDAAAFGQIKYIVAPSKTENTTDFTTTSSSYQTTNLSASITPTSSSNRIKISVSGMLRTTGLTEAFLTVARGTTDLSAATNGFARLTGVVAATSQRVPVSFVWIDSPATTSSTTYNVRIRNDDATGTVGFGGSTSQVMILEEVV